MSAHCTLLSNKPPKPAVDDITHILPEEGLNWVPFRGGCRYHRVHALKFASGRIWDTLNGWRS